MARVVDEDAYIDLAEAHNIDTSTWFGKQEVEQKLHSEPWYHGRISRQDAQALLTDLEPGSYVVRVSERHEGYAITLLYDHDGQRRYSHIMVLMHDNGDGSPTQWLVQDKQFDSVKDVILYYKENRYKALCTLKFCAKELAAFEECDNPYANIDIAGNPMGDPTVKAAEAGLPPPVPPRSIENLPDGGEGIYESGHIYAVMDDQKEAKVLTSEDADGYAVPSALMAKSAVIDFASEDMYLSIEQATTVKGSTLKKQQSMKAPPLPKNPKSWGAVEVIQYLKQEGLGVFQNVIYRNGVVGKTFLKLNSSMFPAGKFSADDLASFDAAMFKLKMTLG